MFKDLELNSAYCSVICMRGTHKNLIPEDYPLYILINTGVRMFIRAPFISSFIRECFFEYKINYV